MADDGSSTDRPVVLVVSEDPQIREEASFGFPPEVEVRFARDSTEAWPLLQETPPSLVIADLQTGNAGGFALSRDMAQVERLAKIPVFMLLEREQDAWLARQAGARKYRKKPMEANDFVDEALELIGD